MANRTGSRYPSKVTKGGPAQPESLAMLDRSPMTVSGFRFRARGVEPIGKPSREEWGIAYEWAMAVESASQYWVGDLLAYAEDRQDWKDKFEQMKTATGYAEQTLHNMTHVSRRIGKKARELAPTHSHAKLVTALEPPDQLLWLGKAKDDGLTVSELQREIRAASRRKVLEGQAVLEGQYRVILADPPWTYGNSQPSASSAKRHYPTMTIDAIAKLPVAAHATPNAVLFMWVTSPLLMQNPGPREIIEAWGFEYKTSMIWHKRRHNFGHYVSVRHELVLICTRGSCLPDRPTPMPDSVFTSNQDLEHSEKPEDLRKIIEKLYDGPYLELFARRNVPGWTTFGNDARLWQEEKAATA